jgi:hypothetical protein
MSGFDYIQTFKISQDAVARATDIMLTSIEIFFKGKPASATSVSGQTNPGISVWICEVENDRPLPNRIVKNSTLSIPYDKINTSSRADTATVIGFTDPVVLKTSAFYGLVIKFNDPAFDIWVNKQGDRLVGATGVTNNPSPGSQSRFEGNLYKSNNSGNFDAFNDRDLKIKINVAKFTSSTKTFSLVNKDYEFLTIDTTYTSTFQGGELVYQQTANSTGTITVSMSATAGPTIVGSGTTFSSHNVGDTIIVANGSVSDAVKIASIANNTSLTLDRAPNFTGSGNYAVAPVARVYYTDYTKNSIILADSSANATNLFAIGNRFVGVRSGATANIASIDRWSVDHFKPTFLVSNPTTSQFTLNYAMANSSNQLGSSTNLDLLKFNDATYDGYILSRSTEVNTSISSSLFGTNRKSAVANLEIQVNVDANTMFSVPYINTGQLDFFFYQNDINETITETRTPTAGFPAITEYDTETGKNGLGKSKYISKKVDFAADRNAEDLIVYLQGYRPIGSEIKVYAKIHNSVDKETFDDKAWTPLELKNNTDKFSTDDPKDIWEYTYGFPQYPDIQTVLSGAFTTGASSNTITTSVSQASILTTGDLIRLYDPLFPDNHEVFPVSSANTTAIVLFKVIDNVNLISKEVSVDKLKYRNIAWNNISNDNTVRYVSSSYVEYDTYKSFQIKIVLLSSSTHIIPKVEQIQVIGAAA